MNDVKLSVTIVLPGSTMISSQECDKNPFENCIKDSFSLAVKRFDKKTKKSFIKKETYVIYLRKSVPCKQVINMNSDAYENMTSITCPEWFTPALGGINRWKKLSIKERLEYHLERLCSSFNGISYEYVVFND